MSIKNQQLEDSEKLIKEFIMDLYTIIMEFRSGTYVSQVFALSLEEAQRKWVNELNISEIKYFGLKAKSELTIEVAENKSKLLQGMKNVWCGSYVIKGGFILLNIIKTKN